MQNGACNNFWCWEPILQQEGTTLQFSSQSAGLGPWSSVLHCRPTNHIVWITTALPAWISLCLKGENANFFTKLYGRWLFCLISTSSLIITQTARKIQRSENFLDTAINFVYGMLFIGSVTNWKTTALFEPHFRPSHRVFQFHSAQLILEGEGAEERREVMILAATPLWFAKIAAWQIWFLKYLMFC